MGSEMCIRDRFKEELNGYKTVTLDRWADESQKGLQQAALGDQDHVMTAFNTIVLRNPELDGQFEHVEICAPKVRRVFQGIKVPLTNL